MDGLWRLELKLPGFVAVNDLRKLMASGGCAEGCRAACRRA
jgi:hypothetical protein